MLRRIINTGIVAGFGALACAGCSSPSPARTVGATNAQLAGRSAAMPVSTSSRTPASHRRGVTRFPPAPAPADAAQRSVGLEIDAGTPTSSDGLKEPTMPDSVASSLLESATVLELRGNLEAARQQFERALLAAPHDMKVLVGFARFADRHGQGSVAAEMYQRVLEEEGTNPLLWSEAGLSLCQNGRGEAGLAACRKALAAAPDSARCQANLAEALVAARHFRDGDARLVETRNAGQPPTASAAAIAGTPAQPVSASTDGAVGGAAADSAPSRTNDVAQPFSPGSTARQFERALPPVKSSRRPTETNLEEKSSDALAPEPASDLDLGPNSPPERSRFVPPNEATDQAAG